MALLSRSNSIIDDLLTQDLSNKKCWVKCSNDFKVDRQAREKVQREMIRIANSIRCHNDVKNCAQLREILKECGGSSEKFFSSRMQDVGEFLSYLFGILCFDIGQIKETIYLPKGKESKEGKEGKGDKWVQYKQFTQKGMPPIISVPSSVQPCSTNSLFQRAETYVLDDDNIYDGKYKNVRKTYSFMMDRFVAINVNRLSASGFVYTPIHPVQRIGSMKLDSIIVFRSDHYTLYYEDDDGIWYHYNDQPYRDKHTIDKIGTYEDMLRSRPSPITSSVLIIYS